MKRAFLALFLAAALWHPSRVQAQPEALPAFPEKMAASEQSLLTQSAVLLSKGEFDQASAVLKSLLPPARVRLYIDWTPVPKGERGGYQQATEQAIKAWNEALNGLCRFQVARRDTEADLLLLFDRDVAQAASGQTRLVCMETAPDRTYPGGEGIASCRTGQIHIALRVPYTERLHPAASIGHLASQGLGAYLGLAPTQDPTGVMGPDSHTGPLPLKPSEAELKQVKAIHLVRLQLMDLARRHVAVEIPRAVLVIEQTEMDAGEVLAGEGLPFAFKARNAGSLPLELKAHPT